MTPLIGNCPIHKKKQNISSQLAQPGCDRSQPYAKLVSRAIDQDSFPSFRLGLRNMLSYLFSVSAWECVLRGARFVEKFHPTPKRPAATPPGPEKVLNPKP